MNNRPNIRDKYNNPIKIGSKVAFNVSGDVVIGWVKEILPSSRYGKTLNEYTKEVYYNFNIKHQKGNRISTVRNRGSIVVL